jgi:multidrug transporter EmrE-like cation transporter
MKILLYTFPVAVLVAYSQLVVKWRAQLGNTLDPDQKLLQRFIGYFSDGYIISGYFAALLSSFIWLIVIPRIPLSIGFPIYIGSTFLLVMLGSWLVLHETISLPRLLAATLILVGIALGTLK